MNIGNTVQKIIASALLTLLVALPAAADAPVVVAAIDLQTLPSVPTYSPADHSVAPADVSTVSLAGTAIGLNRAGIVASAADFTALPVLNVGSVPPLVMFVMSRDEQLFIKAYSDYTDLDGDGVVDTTYNNAFDYSGYFDQSLCYTYSSSDNGQFKASAAATNHQCDGSSWSGNFMNWVAMSRIDVLRFVLYGGKRSTDTSTTTVLERATIPDDLHAWAKVYIGTDVNSYTPFSQDADDSGVSFCNSTRSSGGAPSMRVAAGNWSEWASTEVRQCNWKEDNSSAPDDVPSYGDSGSQEYTVRVQVCDPTTSALRESFCERYKNGGTASYKPRGLLQQYGENGAMRFGLITGSFGNPRSGGRLRRNIGKLAGNGPLDADGNYTGCVSTDEINLTDGTFCNQDSGDEGIVNTLNRIQLTQWNYSNNWIDCSQYGILNRTPVTGSANGILNDPGTGSFNCSAWGNPLSEMYDEALRYIAADGSPDTDFTKNTDLDGLPTPAWQDPYGKDTDGQVRNPYCAACSIIVLSTGLNSFDSDELPTWTKTDIGLGGDAPAEATSSIGAYEDINGGQYLVGRVVDSQSTLAVGNAADTYTDLCTGKTLTNLSLARGICPDIPTMEGSYLIAGLAYDAWTKDMRPGLLTPNGNPRPSGFKNEVQTYAIALAENTPKFQMPVSGTDITLAPLCQANGTGTAAISDGGWRSCYLGAVGVGSRTSRLDTRYVYGRPLENDASAGSFSLVWEDSLWGNDHDKDVVSMVTYCVGAQCERSSNLPTGPLTTGAAPKLCFYIDTQYGGGELCPAVSSANLSNYGGWDKNPSSIKIPDSSSGSDYTVTLYSGQNFTGNTLTLTANSSHLNDFTQISYPGGGSWNDKPRSFKITGGPVPPPAPDPSGPTFAGYDICWQSDSSICTNNNGTPAVADNEVLVRVETLSANAGNAMLTGYAITGSDNDGVKRLTLRPGGSNYSLLNQTPTIPSNWVKPQVTKYTLGTNGAKNLENPLFYAAKYGGFTDRNGDNKPDSASEWDQVDNETGETGADGLPDNFFQVRNPAQLGARLSRAFNAILARSGSGTAAAVVSNSANGIGLTYQALYQSERSDDDGRKVTWSGTLNGLWTDSYGYLREDSAPVESDGSHVLESYDVDPVITFFYDATDGKTKFKREIMPANSDGSAVTTFDETKATSTVQNLEDLKTVWSGQEGLWDVGLNTTTQRNYSSKFSDSTGRYIFTWIDANHNGQVDSGEQKPFLFSNKGFKDTNFRFLNTSSENAAKKLVQWTRGTEIEDTDASGTPLWRSRTIKYDSPTKRVLRLGDIVNSTPVVVGTPAEAFDLLYNDKSFGTFRKFYRDRRQVVYVGSNDGMVHAFNAGFYNAAAHQLQLQPPGTTSGSVVSTVTAQPLGAELWAYVPGNLLPHLRWLADPDYSHMYYVDGSPIAQDVRVFDDSDCTDQNTTCTDSAGHVDGWGTILIVPFRFGGGPISVPTQLGVNTGNGRGGWQNSYSAYVVMDITDPESPPVLLGELTNTEVAAGADTNDTQCKNKSSFSVTCADLKKIVHTYTSSLPAAAMFRDSADNDPNKFYLFTGSGTTDNAGVGTTEGGKGASDGGLTIRAYDIADLADNEVTPVKTFDFTDTGSAGAGAESFAGDLIASDFNLNGLSEALYFGSVKYNESGSSFGGSLWKINFKTGAASASKESSDPDKWTQQEMLSNLNLPVTAHATVGVSDQGKPMVFFGTGRAFTKDDLGDQTQQKIIGMFDTSLLDPDDTQYKALPLSLADLVDVSDIQVQAKADGGAISDAGSYTDTSGTAHTINDFQSLVDSFDQQDRLGWYINLQNHPLKADGTQDLDEAAIASERVVSSQALLGGVLLTTTFLPGTDSCSDVGSGRLYGTNYKTGTADPSLAYFGTTAGTGTASGQNVLNRSTDLGPGLPAAPSLHVGDGTGQRVFRACVQTSTGAIICKDITTLKDVQSGEISWREPLDK